MKLRKRIGGLALCLALVLSLLPGNGRAAAYMDSGCSSLPKLTKEEVALLVQPEAVSQPEAPYLAAPSTSAPYSAGSVRQEVLQAGLNRLNNLRRIAGLPAVALDDGYTAMTQAAALVNAANNAMSHTPAPPAGMDSALYQLGREGASSSNIAIYLGWKPENGPIAFSVDMWMDDSDENNVARLGHRRWQLNPQMAKTGFGAATAVDGWIHTAEYAFDRSAAALDYDFISWPASGYFPNSIPSLFHADTAWSVTVNPDKYAAPEGASVSLRRESDGKTWSFRQGGSYAAGDSGLYFNVDTSYRGINNCIIFRPDGVEKYEGVYTVTIGGLKTTGGAAAEISYQVEFFNPEAYWPKPVELPFRDVPEDAWYRTSVEAVYSARLMAGSGDQFNPAGTLSLAETVTLAARMYAAEHGESVPEGGEGPWYQAAYDYCAAQGLVDSATLPLSEMTRPATRFEMVSILDGAISPERMTEVVADPAVPDLQESDPYGAVVYRWYRAGILTGGSDGSFRGESNITRAETAKILCEINQLG